MAPSDVLTLLVNTVEIDELVEVHAEDQAQVRVFYPDNLHLRRRPSGTWLALWCTGQVSQWRHVGEHPLGGARPRGGQPPALGLGLPERPQDPAGLAGRGRPEAGRRGNVVSDRPISAIAREILARWPQATVRSSWLLGVEVDLGDLRMRVVGDPDAFTWQASVTASAATEDEHIKGTAPCSATDPDPVRAAERALHQYDAGAAGKGAMCDG